MGAVGLIVSCLQNMWIERTTFVTAYPLPGILRWFAVTSTTTVRRGWEGRGAPLVPGPVLPLPTQQLRGGVPHLSQRGGLGIAEALGAAAVQEMGHHCSGDSCAAEQCTAVLPHVPVPRAAAARLLLQCNDIYLASHKLCTALLLSHSCMRLWSLVQGIDLAGSPESGSRTIHPLGPQLSSMHTTHGFEGLRRGPGLRGWGEITHWPQAEGAVFFAEQLLTSFPWHRPPSPPWRTP